MFIKYNPFVAFEVADPAGGGGAAPAGVQPGNEPVPGQGPGQEPNAGGDFWGLFPNVPEEHRPLIEPHIREMQGHVTRLEQQLAPFKPFAAAGLTPEQSGNLIQFSQDFDSQPVDMWLRIGQMLQQPGPDGQSVLDPDIDLEYLAALANGQDPDAVDQGAQPNGGPTLEGLPPEMAQYVQSLQTSVQQLTEQVDGINQRDQQRTVQQQEETQNQLLQRQQDQMKTTLTESGYPEESLTDEVLISSIIAHRGDIAAATKALMDQRTAILKGFTQEHTNGNELELPNGTPPTKPRTPEPTDSWGKARAGAAAELRRNNRSAAQG